MRVNVSDISAQRIFLGWTGENKHVQFAYDASKIFAEYPDAGAGMTIQPPVGDAYPHTLTRDGNILLWEVLASDCAHAGDGVYQITFTQGEVVCKSLKGFYTVKESLTGSGEAPTPVQDWIADAEAALFALTGMQARAVTLDPGSAATAQIVEENGRKVIVIGVPEGLRGETGAQGIPGVDGKDGAPGKDGADGVTPAFSIGTVTTLPAGSPATVTITGTTEAPVLNLGIPRGADGQAGDLIDDNAGAGVTGKTWSANKLAADQTAVLSAISQKQDKPQTPGTAGQVLGLDSNLDPAWVDQTGGGGGEGMTDEEKLLQSELPGTSQTVVFSDSKPASITHTANNVAVRTDVFVWGSENVTETRTLANGKYIVIETNLTTLSTTVSAVQEAA